MSSLDPGKQAREAKRLAGKQQQEIDRQKQIEQRKSAEEADVIGRKKALTKGGGRSLLKATAPGAGSGTATTLGGL